VVQVAAGASYTFAVTDDGLFTPLGLALISALDMGISMMNFVHVPYNYLRGGTFM
jgi:hypothetical protein